MTNKELQAARRGLFLDVAEAAEHIGNVSVRTWQRWERGDFNIPDDVEETINGVCEKRMQFIDAIDELLQANQVDEIDVDYYSTLAEYQADHKDATVLDWRISQSVASYYYLEGSASLS